MTHLIRQLLTAWDCGKLKSETELDPPISVRVQLERLKQAREDSELATPAIDGVAVTNHIRCDDASSMEGEGDERRRSISHFGPSECQVWQRGEDIVD